MYSRVPVGFTTEFIRCPQGIPCLHAPKYTLDPTHLVDWGELIIDVDETFEKGPVHILDSRDQVLRCKTMRLVMVLWQHGGVEKATWEREDTMHVSYPFLFQNGGVFS